MSTENRQTPYRRSVNDQRARPVARRDGQEARANVRRDGRDDRDGRVITRQDARAARTNIHQDGNPANQPRRRSAGTPKQKTSAAKKRSFSKPSTNQERSVPLVLLIVIVVALAVIIGLVIHSCATAGQGGEGAQGDSFGAIGDTSAPEQPATAQTNFTNADSSLRHGSYGDYSDYAIWRSEAERKATSSSDNETVPGVHVAYLTFDDGPSDNTHRILDILDKYEIKATWFVKADVESVALVRDIWEAGHQVAIHTYSHEYEEIYASSSAFWNDMDHAGEIINGYLGFTPTLIRFPGGSFNGYNRGNAEQLTSEVDERGWHYFDWNVSCGDSGSDRSPSRLLQNVIAEADGNNSSMILMHDDGAKIETVEALEDIIQWLLADGYEFDVVTADTYGYHF